MTLTFDLTKTRRIIEALCEMLDDDCRWGNRDPELPLPDWITIALARKQAKEGKGSTIDEILEETP